MACRSGMRLFIPNETKEKMAAENARLLMQAQTDLGTLSGQFAAGTEGTKKQIEWYQGQVPAAEANTTQFPMVQIPIIHTPMQMPTPIPMPTPMPTPTQTGWSKQGQRVVTQPTETTTGQTGWHRSGQGSSTQTGWHQQAQHGTIPATKADNDRPECIIT